MEQGHCPACGALLPPDVSGGPCASCLMQLGLLDTDTFDDPSSDEGAALEREVDLEGPYAIVRRLGEGGMGIVYLAEQTATGRRVALKILHPEVALD